MCNLFSDLFVTINIVKLFQSVVDKHRPSDEMIKELDNMLSKLNAMEIVASEGFQKNSIKIHRALVEGQMHSINEFQHLKKAIDLLTVQLFKIQDDIRS